MALERKHWNEGMRKEREEKWEIEKKKSLERGNKER